MRPLVNTANTRQLPMLRGCCWILGNGVRGSSTGAESGPRTRGRSALRLGLVMANEVVGSEVGKKGSVTQEVVGRGEDRGSDSNGGLLRSAPGLQPQEPRLEIGALGVRHREDALDQDRFEPGRSLVHPGRAPLAGALVEPRHRPGPGQQVT
jgi:hypothetical protein